MVSATAQPRSMACRHFGNILSGVVIDGLIYAALATATKALFGLIPGAVGNVLGTIPFLSVGLPAITSLYFDWFSGVMQAFIFCMLTIMYIANAAEEVRYLRSKSNLRSEERRVGKECTTECRSRWSAYH